MRRLLVKRIWVLPLLAVLFLLPRPGLSLPAPPEVVERFQAPVSGAEMTVYRDPVTGEKWVEDPDGRRYADVTAVRHEELSRLGDPASRIAPALRDLLADPEEADEPIPIALVLREQPLHAVAAARRADLRRDVDRLMADARSIWARVESRLPSREERARLPVAEQVRREAEAMTEAEAATVREAVGATRERIRRHRSEVLAETALRCGPTRVAALARMPDVEVDGTSDILNTIFVTVAPSRLPSLLIACPEIWAALPVPTVETSLNVSVPVIGAGTFWTGGVDGSGVSVGVLDSGMDNLHPSIKSAITSEQVFLTYGKLASNFNDDATTTDDLHGHGTHVAGTAAGQDTTYTGVAKKASLVNAKCFYRTNDSPPRASGDGRDIFAATVWAVARADVLNLSFGGTGGDGDSLLSRFYDAVVHDLDVHVAAAAGNGGSSGGIDSPGDGFNVVTVGAYDDKNTSSQTDDAIASFSGRGATSDGRRKPTFSAPGVSIMAPNNVWEGSNPDHVTKSGTSMATPHVAGAMALVLDYKSTYTPQAVKALLLNTCLNTSPAPTSPDNNWGWGGLDLTAAYSGRADVLEGTLTSSGPESLYYKRTSSLSSGKRATLVWNRHVTYSSSSWPGSSPSLTDLDLYLYDGTDGTEDVKSTSSVNSVEQVKASGTVPSPVLRAHRSASFPTGVSSEPFALAHAGSFAVADPPTLACTFGTITSPIGPSKTFDVVVNVSNTGDLTAFSPSVTLTLPSGWTLQSGTNPRTISNVAADGSGSATFSVKCPSTTTLGTYKAKVESTCFGDTFESTEVTKTQQVDATAPTGTVSINGGDTWTSSSSVTLTLSATDGHSGVSRMRFSNDGSSWSSWETYGTSKSWSLASGDGTRTAYVQFEDGVGNVSTSATDTISVDTTAPTGTISIDSGAAWTGTTSVTLTLSASDAGSGISEMRFSNDGSTWSTWETYSTSKSWTLTSGEGTKTVHAQFRDAVDNASSSVTDGIGLDATAPTGSVTIAGGAAWATSTSVTLTLLASDATSGVDEMRFSNDGSSWSTWESYATSKSWTMAAGDGTKTVYAQFRDNAGNASSSATDTIGLDTTAPTASVLVDSGATWTSSTSVSLTVSATDAGSGASEMRFSNDGSTWSTWESYGTSKSWTLAAGDGAKTVSLQVRDTAGNVSTTATDGISLDTTAPAGTVSIAGGAAWTSSTSVTLTLSATDGGSGVDQMRFSSDGSTWGAWESYATTKAWTLTGGDGTKTAYVEYRDAVGNASSSVTDTIGLDTTAPSGTVSIEGGAAWTTSTSVTLTLSASDATSGVDEMRFSNDGSTWSTWESYATSKSWTMAAGDGTKTVHAQFRDGAGNTSTSATDTIGLDTTAPSASVLVDAGAAWTSSTSVSLTVSATDTGSGAAEMRFSNDGSTWSTWESFATSKSWTLAAGDGAKTVSLQVRDTAGNVSTTATDGISLDTTAPAGTVSIAGGAAWTSSTSVTLTLSATDGGSGVDQMRFSSDGSTWGAWESYATTKAWTLTGGDGTKTAYVEYRDAVGNASSSVTDAIGLDTTAPSGTVSIAGGAAWTTSTSVTLTLSASDATSGVDEMRFSNDGSTWSAWESYATSKSWTMAAGDGTKTVHAQFRDGAGNTSTSATDTIGLDTTAPSASVLVDAGAAWTSSTSVSLTVSATDTGSGAAEMRFSNDGSTWSTWESFATSKSRTLAAGDGAKTVSLQVRDTAGNVSTTATDGISLDTTAPAGTVSIAGGAAWTSSTSVTLTLSATDGGSGVDQMRFSSDGSTWGAWESYATTKAWTLTGGDGTKTAYVEYRDAVGNASSSVTDTIGLDTTAPSGTVSIEGGAAWTTSTSVTLTLSASDATSGVDEMRFSNDGTSWSAWESYAVSKSWTMTAGDGTKTVYAQFRDGAGNTSTSATDTIGLDTTAPSASVLVDAGATWTSSTSVSLTVSATDTGSGAAEMRFSNDGSTWSTWESFATSKSWTLAAGDGSKTVSLQVRDTAGNVSTTATDGISLDTTAPAGTVSIEGGAAWTSSTSVTLTLSATDGGSGVSDMRFSSDGSTWGAWESYATTKAWTLTGGDGTKTAYVEYRDAVGNASSSVTDTIGLDTTAPSGTVSIEGGAAWTTSTSVTLTLSASDATSGVDEMRFSNDGTSWSAWESYAVSKSWTMTAGDGTKTVYAQFRDGAGNTSTSATDTIGLDTTAPSASVVVDGGATWASSTSVSLTVSATDTGSGAAEMRFSNDGSSWSTWESYGTSKSWTLDAGDGSKTVSLQVRDTAGNVSTTATDGISLDTTAPAGTVSIAGGAAWTSSTSVTLTLSATDGGSGVDQMRFSNDGSSWSAWETYGTAKSWTLASGDGSKTASLQVRDAAGNVSTTASDGISLDTTAPTGTVSIAAGAAWTSTASVTLTLSSSDDGSGVSEMRLSSDGSTWGSWESVSTSRAWTLTGSDGTKSVVAQFRDAVGNAATAVTDTIGLDTTAPTGSVTIAGGAAWTASTGVTLTLVATDVGSGVSEMRLSADGSTWGSWETYVTSKPWTLPAGDGSKTVHAQFRDSLGNSSAAVTDSISLDTTAPSGTVSIAAGATWTSTTAVTLTLVASDGSGSGVAEMRFSHDGSTWSPWESSSTSAAWTLTSGDGTKTVHAQFRDAAGNVSGTSSDTIGLDGTAPTATVTLAGGIAWTSATDVALELDAEDTRSGVDSMRLSDDGTGWGPWTAYASSRTWSLSGSDGTKRAYAQFRDAAGNESTVFTDAIGLDRTGPSGTVVVNGGSAWTRSAAVPLGLVASDAGAGVAEMSFSTDGTTWSAWTTFGSSGAVTLPFGDGTKTVHARFRDGAGNASAAATDSIVLDTTPPSGSLVLEGGWPATSSRTVAFEITGSDAHSGLAQMRFSDDGAAWGAWTSFGATGSYDVPAGEGLKTVHVMLRDGAGNESASFDATIRLDQTSPSGTFTANDDAPYVLPDEDLVFDVDAADDTGGSGIRDFKVSYDGGASWSGWYPLDTGPRVKVDPPSPNGRRAARVVVRDVAGNESSRSTRSIHFVESPPRLPGPGAKFAGRIADATDVDSIAIDVARGDLLTLKMKVRADDKQQDLQLALDLVTPTGVKILEARLPDPTKKIKAKNLEIPASGRYYLVVHRIGGTTSSGTYTLKTKVKQAKANAKPKGDLVGGVGQFEAAAGSTFEATVKAEGVTADAVTLVGPDGPVPFEFKEKTDKVTIQKTVLSAGTGPYEIRVAGVAAGSFKGAVSLPKKPKETVPE